MFLKLGIGKIIILSFERFINHYIFYLYMAENSLETTIQKLEDSHVAEAINQRLPYSLDVSGATLLYSRRAFMQNPNGYIDEQLIALQKHLEMVQEDHSYDHRMYERDNEVYGKLDKFMSKARYVISSAAYLLRGTTPESLHRKRVQSSRQRERLYTLLNDINDAGRGFFEWLLNTREARRLSPDYREQLQECIRISSEISIKYSNLIAIAQRRAELHQRFYRVLPTQR